MTTRATPESFFYPLIVLFLPSLAASNQTPNVKNLQHILVLKQRELEKIYVKPNKLEPLILRGGNTKEFVLVDAEMLGRVISQ